MFSVSRTGMIQVDSGAQERGDRAAGMGNGDGLGVHDRGREDLRVVVSHLDDRLTPLQAATGLVGAAVIPFGMSQQPRGGGVHAGVEATPGPPLVIAYALARWRRVVRRWCATGASG
jgi:hypothetical protein